MTPPDDRLPSSSADARSRAGAPLFVIAEIGLNHGGSLDRALALVDAAAEAGAVAIKLQTIDARPTGRARLPGAGARRRATRCATSSPRSSSTRRRMSALVERARARGLRRDGDAVLASARSDCSTRVGVDAYKIASGDLTFDAAHRALRRARGKPLVISTGMASIDEVAHALATARERRRRATIALLHCVSAYPVPRGEREPARDRHARAGVRRAGRPVRSRRRHVRRADGGGARRLLYERHLVLDGRRRRSIAAVSSTPASSRRRHRRGGAARPRSATGAKCACRPRPPTRRRAAARSMPRGDLRGRHIVSRPLT